MAKEGKEKKREPSKGGKRRLHLREIRTRQAADGSLVHHHTYADSAEAPHEHPERGPMATSKTPADAGQHVEEMFGMNQQGAGGAGGMGGDMEGEGEGAAEEA
jgi:hypothetical protein